MRTTPFIVYFLVVVDEDIDAGELCSRHPTTGMLVKADFKGGVIWGVAREDLKNMDVATVGDDGSIVRFGYVQKGDPVFKCATCEDGNKESAFRHSDVCADCGFDRIPF